MSVYLLQVIIKGQVEDIASLESRLTAMEREVAELKAALRQVQSAGK